MQGTITLQIQSNLNPSHKSVRLLSTLEIPFYLFAASQLHLGYHPQSCKLTVGRIDNFTLKTSVSGPSNFL